MTANQKKIIKELINGGEIANLGKSGIRLRDQEGRPVIKVSAKTFWFLRDILRKKKALFILNRAAVRKLHGSSWIKKEYKKSFTK